MEKNFNEIELHKRSFENFSHNLGNTNEKYGEEIAKAQALLKKVSSDYTAALTSQLVKIGVLEILLPFSLGLFAVIYSSRDVLSLIKRMIQ